MGGLAASLVAPEALAQTEPGAEALSVNILTRMAANIRVEGRRAVFVLDTGAERTAIASDLAQSLNLSPGPEILVHGVTAARTVTSAFIERLTFGGRAFTDIVAPVFDRRDLAADGLIGLDVLSQFRLELDLARRHVLVYGSPRTLVTVPWPTRLETTDRARVGRFGQLILLNVLADGIEVEAFVDSGAQYSIGNRALLTALDGTVEAGSIDVFGVTGQTLRARLGRVDDLRIDGHNLGATPLLFADLHAFETLGLRDRPAILLGADILYRFQRVTLDYGRGRVAFGRVRPAFTPPPVVG
jgi:hypothetical protein